MTKQGGHPKMKRPTNIEIDSKQLSWFDKRELLRISARTKKTKWPEMETTSWRASRIEEHDEHVKDLCEFGIVDKACYFCGQPRTIIFQEHSIFCPNCSAIYCKMILQESHCKHFTGDQAIVIDLEPCYAEYRNKPYIMAGDKCSICGLNVWADGI